VNETSLAFVARDWQRHALESESAFPSAPRAPRNAPPRSLAHRHGRRPSLKFPRETQTRALTTRWLRPSSTSAQREVLAVGAPTFPRKVCQSLRAKVAISGGRLAVTDLRKLDRLLWERTRRLACLRHDVFIFAAMALVAGFGRTLRRDRALCRQRTQEIGIRMAWALGAEHQH